MNSSEILFAKEKTSIQVRVLSLSFSDKKCQQWVDIACLFIEYIQLISQLFLLSSGLYDEDDGKYYNLKAIMLPIAKIFSTGHLLDLKKEHNKGFIISIFALLFALCIMKYLLCFYVLIIAKKEKQGNSLAIWVWKLIVKTQARIIYLFVTSFWSNILFAVLQEEIKISPLGEKGWVAWSLIAIILEIVFTFFPQFYLVLVIPRKDFLASKHHRLEIVNIFQKFLLQILQIILKIKFGNLWVYFSISLVLSMARYRIYFTTLPLYKLQALFYQAICLALELSFGISFFFQTIISSNREISINFALLSWIILSLLTIKINIAILDKTIINIFAGNNLTNSFLMIHRIHMIEEIGNQNKHMPGFLSRYQRLSLLHTVGSNYLLPSCKNEFYTDFLSLLLIKFPKSNYAKLIAGYYFVKKLNLLSTGIHKLKTLQNSSSLSGNAAFIISKTQNTQKKQYENSQSLLDLSTYLRHLSNMNYFKGEILKQASAQESLCKHVLSHPPDLAKIFDISQFIHKIRGQIEKKTDLFINSFPEYYLEPQALCLFYHNILNFSAENSQKETQLLERRIEKYSRAFYSDKFIPENLYQHQNCCFLLSGSRETFGKILFSSTNAKQYFGQDLHGKYDYHLMMPFISSQVKEQTRIISQIKSYINKETETFCYNHKEGFVFPANCYLNLYPFLGQGLNYMVIIRPKLSSKDFLILSENGDIQGFSQNIGKTLNLFSSTATRINITSILSKQLPPNQNFEEKIIEFTNQNSRYLCKMETLNIFEISMKVLTLEKLSHESFTSEEEDLEEKAEGWIDLNHLSDNKTEMGLPTSPVSTKRLLLLPTTQNHEDETTNKTQVTSHRKILKNHRWNSFFAEDDSHSNSSKTNSSRATLKRMYYQNMATKFYPRFYKPLIVALYVIFLVIIAQQIAFRTILSDYLENLKAIKNTLRVTESRNNMLMEVHRQTRYIWSLGPGGLPPGFYGATNLFYFTLGFGPKVTELAKLNKKVVAAANFLDAQSRNVLFQRDVRFFETDYGEPIQQYSNMTNFQACDRVIQTGFRYQKLVTYNITQAIPYMESVMRNCLNDLLIKLTTTAQFYLAALDEQKENNNIRITGILIFTLACESLVAVIFCVAAYQQFKSEKRNMVGFMRVDKTMVQLVLERVVQFKINIEEGIRFDNLADEKIISLKSNSTLDLPNNKVQSNRKESYNFRIQGLILKYQKRVLQMMLILTFVITVTILNFVNGRNGMNTLFTKALKVHTADQIQPKLALGQTAFVDLALKNDTTLIKNIAPSLVVANSISVIADIRNNQFSLLKRDDRTFDPTIQDVLYGDACKYAGENYAYCLKISRGLENFGLVQMLVNYEKLLTSVNEQYSLATVKSKDLLESLLFEAYSTAGSSMTFLKGFTTIIADIINKEFENYFETNENKFNSLNVAYLIMLFISCAVIHLVLLNRLKESEDQYRKVLQTLPPNIILNNLFIKTYLKKSSHALFISVSK